MPAPAPDTGPPGPGWVTGEFVGYEDEPALESALGDLDPLEGVEEGLFERRAVAVVLDSGHSYVAWAYIFTEDRLGLLERKAIELPEGDWARYLG